MGLSITSLSRWRTLVGKAMAQAGVHRLDLLHSRVSEHPIVGQLSVQQVYEPFDAHGTLIAFTSSSATPCADNFMCYRYR